MRKAFLGLFSLMVFTFSAIVLRAQDLDEHEEPLTTYDWSLALRSRVNTAEFLHGVDVGGDQGTFGYGASLSHASGLNGSVSTLFGIQTGNKLSVSWGVGYDFDITEAFSGSVDFSHTNYQTDSLSAFASLGNTLAVGLDYDFGVVAFACSIERLFGSSPATAADVSISGYFETGLLTIIPSFDIAFLSQTIDLSKIAILKGKGFGRPNSSSTSSSKVAGISGMTLDVILTCPLGSGFSLSATPSILYSPNSDVSIRPTTFSISAGIKYGIDF